MLADALLYYSQDSSEKMTIVIETHKAAIAPLSSYLMTYKLRSKVKITNSTNYITVLDRSGSAPHNDVTSENNAEELSNIAMLKVQDPRILSFGTRLLFKNAVNENSGEYRASETSGMVEGSEVSTIEKKIEKFCDKNSANEYHLLRLLNGLSEGPEIVNKIPLECNLDLLNYIDFSKGCYVGQELTARTKFKV